MSCEEHEKYSNLYKQKMIIKKVSEILSKSKDEYKRIKNKLKKKLANGIISEKKYKKLKIANREEYGRLCDLVFKEHMKMGIILA